MKKITRLTAATLCAAALTTGMNAPQAQAMFNASVVSSDDAQSRSVAKIIVNYELEENGKLHKNTIMCTGTLISDTWIITADHCISDLNRTGAQVNITLGPSTEDGEKVQFEKAISGKAETGFDVGLVKLKSPAKTIPAEITEYKDINAAPNSKIQQYGWGGFIINDEGIQKLKKKAPTARFSLTTGTGHLLDHDREVSIAGYKLQPPTISNDIVLTDKSSTKVGDSGGPTFLDGKLYGVLSGGGISIKENDIRYHEYGNSLISPIPFIQDWIRKQTGIDVVSHNKKIHEALNGKSFNFNTGDGSTQNAMDKIFAEEEGFDLDKATFTSPVPEPEKIPYNMTSDTSSDTDKPETENTDADAGNTDADKPETGNADKPDTGSDSTDNGRVLPIPTNSNNSDEDTLNNALDKLNNKENQNNAGDSNQNNTAPDNTDGTKPSVQPTDTVSNNTTGTSNSRIDRDEPLVIPNPRDSHQTEVTDVKKLQDILDSTTSRTSTRIAGRASIGESVSQNVPQPVPQYGNYAAANAQANNNGVTQITDGSAHVIKAEPIKTTGAKVNTGGESTIAHCINIIKGIFSK